MKNPIKLYIELKNSFSMQVFEVIELPEFPFMATREVIEGTTVRDIINENVNRKVFLLIDHNLKRIWIYNALKSPFKIQVYGAILAGLLRQQLKLFYRIYPLNLYSQDDQDFQELLDKPIGGGRARAIERQDFGKQQEMQSGFMLIVNPKLNKAMEYLKLIPPPQNFIRRFLIIGGTIYTDEEITESLITEQKTIVQQEKLGRLNNGFTFFKDHKYSTRLIINERKIQGIELYIDKEDKAPSLELKIPIIYEEKFTKPGNIKDLEKSFLIPKQLLKDKQ